MHWDGNNVWHLLGDANHHFNLYGLNIFISLERDEADCRAFLTFPPKEPKLVQYRDTYDKQSVCTPKLHNCP